MTKNWCARQAYSPCKFWVLCISFLIPFTFQNGIFVGTVPLDYDCSQVECPIDSSNSCPPDSVERQQSPFMEVLYGPEDLMPEHELYDDVDEEGDVVDHHFDELPMELAATYAQPQTINSTSSQLPEQSNTLKDTETGKDNELILVKRELKFENAEDADVQERMLQECCPTMMELNRRRRRRRRRQSSKVDDCECKPCDALPQCATGEVVIRVHEATGIPGDCCPSYACAPKRVCGDVDFQPYWRDACTRCTCHGISELELCHNECRTNEMEEQETQRVCYTATLNEPMAHGSDWYENEWCTKCHCEHGERECVSSFCLPATCSDPVKVHGQCCPQCPEGEENILIAHENSTTHSSVETTTERELHNEQTTTTASKESSSTVVSSTSNTTNTDVAASVNVTVFTTETTTYTSSNSTSTPESPTTASTLLSHSTSLQTQRTDLTPTSTTVSEISTSTTEVTSTTKSIDEIAADNYFGPQSSMSTADDNSSTQDTLIDNTTQSSIEAPFSSTLSTSQASTSATETSTTTIIVSSTTENFTAESTTITTEMSSTESSSTSNSSPPVHSTTTSTELTEEESSRSAGTLVSASSTPEATTSTTTKPTETITSSTISSTPSSTELTNTISPDTTTSSSTTATSSTNDVDTSSTPTRSSTTSSPPTSTTHAPTSTYTFTTNSPHSSTAASPSITTVVYLYTFSTSAPSPPVPEPTVYQPSVRKFLTRPEVRYIGASVLIALIVICALVVWKFCMPTRSERIKNHYRTVPCSEATSLSHSSAATSHSSMA
ncbi:A-agglutinin anchorage subunit [Ceratitis capitata]|uniref:A-agglutinin anchorage subunit n=1 Tax=Ceratitis capitata TaxID=7213 RepID=UPI000C6C67C3|nr:A-agglutinin anchorage subunit [Ceratitis capitata]